MNSELAFTIFRIGFLALLWLLVLSTVAVLRKDIFGTVVTSRGAGRDTGKKKRTRRSRKERVGGLAEPKMLMVTGGSLEGTSLPLGSAVISIGRSPAATLVLDDPYTSSRHATIQEVDGDWIIEDQGSTNGTFVDEERLIQPRRLQVGETVRIGQTTFQLVK